MQLRDFEGAFQDDKSRILVHRSLPCPIDRSKDAISDKLLWIRPFIQILGS